MLLLSIISSLLSISFLLISPVISYLITTMFSFYFIKIRFLKNPLSSIFIICYCLLYIVGIITQLSLNISFEDKFGEISEEAVTLYHLLANGFLYIYLITILIKEKFLPRSADIIEMKYFLSNSGLRNYLLFSIIMIICSVLLFIINYGGFTNILHMSRVELGVNRTIVSILGLYIAYLITPLYFILGVVFGNKNYKGFARKLMLLLVCLIFSVLVFLVFRIRTFVVTHVFAWAFGYMICRCFNTFLDVKAVVVRYKLPFLKYAFFAVSFIIFIVLLRFQRGALETGQFNRINMDAIFTMIELTVKGGDLGYHFNVMRVIEFSWSGELSVAWDSYIRTLTAVIPSAILDGKPTDTQIVLGRLFNPAIQGLTVPPGINGDAYLNLGAFWGIFPIIVGLAVEQIERRRNASMIIFFGISFSTVFHFSRGSLANTMIIFCVLYVGSYLFVKITGIKKYVVE